MATVITPIATLSYPHLWEPQCPPGAVDAVYSCTLIFEEGADLSALNAEVAEVATAKFGPKWTEQSLRLPFRSDGESKGYPPGSTFMNVKSKQPPEVVDRYGGEDGKPQRIDDPGEMYPGAQVRASLKAYAYDVSGNKGVSFALNNVQKLGDGERIDGRRSAANEFDVTENREDYDLSTQEMMN